MLNSAKAVLYLEPTTVTPVGVTTLPRGVVKMLISPPFARHRRKLFFQVYLEPMMAALPSVAPLLEGIIEKLARLICWVAASSGVVGGGVTGLGSTVVRVGVWQQHSSVLWSSHLYPVCMSLVVFCRGSAAVPLCRPSCCASSRPSHGCRCVAASFVLLVLPRSSLLNDAQVASPTC